MKGIGNLIPFMVGVYLIMQMEVDMKDNGKIGNSMEKEYTIGMMEVYCTKEYFNMENSEAKH